ncbi:MAG: hypothetical protein KQJ78_05940 [Deltaproteobacteria bacterium]|nr:hypothetical protein [Deltaproteobacteria bacterium]
MPRKLWPILVLVVLAACAAPAELQRAQELAAAGHPAEALTQYQKALAVTDDAKERQEILAGIAQAKKVLTDQTLTQAQAILGQNPDPKAQREALAVLRDGLPYDDGRLAPFMKSVVEELGQGQEKTHQLVSEARELAGKGRLTAAADKLEEAQALDPANQEVVDARAVLANDLAGHLAAALDEKDYSLAHRLFNRLNKLDPENPALETARRRMAESELADTRQQVDAAMNDLKWYRAYRLILTSPEKEAMEPEMARARAEGSQFYLEQARQELEPQEDKKATPDLYAAYLALVKAHELDPASPEIESLLSQAANQVDARLQRRLGVRTFASPPSDPDAGPLFSDLLVTQLKEKLPYGVSVLERPQMDQLYAQNNGDLNECGVLGGVDQIVSGAVDLLTTERQDETTTGHAKVKVGLDTVPNPAYQEMVGKYGSDPGKWPEKPPATLSEPRYELVEFRQGEGRLVGLLEAWATVHDVKRGGAVLRQEVRDSHTWSDHFAEAVPLADPPLAGDPLELPTPAQARLELARQAAGELAAKLAASYQDLGKELVDEVNYQRLRQDSARAVEILAKARLFAERTGAPPARITELDRLMVLLTE